MCTTPLLHFPNHNMDLGQQHTSTAIPYLPIPCIASTHPDKTACRWVMVAQLVSEIDKQIGR